MGSPFPRARAIPKDYLKGQPYNTSALTTHSWYVPDGKIWWVVLMSMKPSDSADLSMNVYNADGKQLAFFGYKTAGTTIGCGPEPVAGDQAQKPVLAFEGYEIRGTFGANQTSLTSYMYLQVIEYDIEELRRMKPGK